jgi:tRNA pseudouridine38-40 synthase
VKTRYFIYLQFRGTEYHGWQVQPSSSTVQKAVERALGTILGEKIALTGAGRTDSGVHARFFCAHFDSDAGGLETGKNLLFRLNRFLPSDIAVMKIVRVIPEAHARFSALSRTYCYYITRIKDPFREETSWQIHGKTDIDAMNRACTILMKFNDFTSFSKLHSDNKTNICRIYDAFWESGEQSLVFTIRADRFLRNMVRAITGTMMDVGTGKITPDRFEEIILAKDRCRAGKSAPARGLFLEDIEYPENIFMKE